MEDLLKKTGLKPWQSIMLAWLQLALLVFSVVILVLTGIFGIAGFKAGEMGAIIGFFGVVGLVFLIPLNVLEVFVVIGIFKGKKWAVVVALIFTLLALPFVFFSISGGIFLFLPVLIFYILNLWMEIKCLKHPYFKQK